MKTSLPLSPQQLYARLSRTADIDALSIRYFGIAALVAFLRVLWVICQTSGVFGTPPDTWIIDAEKLSGDLFLISVGLGGVVHAYIISQRMQAETNETLTNLIINAVGAILFFALSERAAQVLTDDPEPFITWAGLLRDGVTLGAVYALIALGYTLVYGILFMINFAHGEVMMFGAYGGWFALMLLLDDGQQSFETGAASLAVLVVPIVVGVLFLPLEDIVARMQTGRRQAQLSEPRWMFSLLSMPVRALMGGVIGYGALVGLGQFAPHIYLLVITIVGLLFVTFSGMLVSIFVAIILERVAYRRFRKAPRLTPLITAIGASIFLQQVALRMFGSNRKTYIQGRPEILSDPLNFQLDFGRLGVVPVSKTGVVIIVTSLGLMALLYFIVQRTKLGRGMRAVAEDKDTSALMGTNVDRVIVMTFILGAALAGAAGVMLGFRGDQIYYRFGFTPGLKAFTAAVLGGIGNVPGAMLGGFFLGLAEALGPTALGIGSEWKNVIAFSLLVLIIIFRPTGLLGEVASEKKV